MRLIHWWRIEDDSFRRSELIREAQHDLIRRAHDRGLHILPGGTFEVVTSCGPEPARMFLVAHVDVEEAA